MSGLGYRFARAIARTPPRSAVDGLRAQDRGVPDLAAMRRGHADYLAAMRAAG